MDNLDAWSGKEKNRYILRWLADGSAEGSVAALQLDTEKRLKILMDTLNSANSKKAVVLKHPGKP